MLDGEAGELGNGVDDAMRIVGAGSDEKDGVGVDESTDVGYRDCV